MMYCRCLLNNEYCEAENFMKCPYMFVDMGVYYDTNAQHSVCPWMGDRLLIKEESK